MSQAPLFADRYQPLSPLGQGSFGVVWRALDHNQHMEVALKMFTVGAPVILRYHEARVLTALEGEHVLRVFNADTDESDIPYIATRIAPFGSAEDFLVTSAPFGVRPDVAIGWIRHMLVGLGSCHAFGLVHRDIKTQNVFLDRSDWALLGDFGLAYPVDASGRAPAGGTPVTTPPEMLLYGYVNYVSDIYATGVTLYRLLTGAWPFDGATPSDVHAAIIHGRYVRVRDAAPHVSRRLADRVERAMAYREADRYQTWRGFHDALGGSNMVRRSWERIAPHPGHIRCWAESGTGTTHLVCVWSVGKTYEIEVRRATTSRSRVKALCAKAIGDRQLGVALRRAFDTL